MEKLTKEQADIEAKKIFEESTKKSIKIIEESKKNGTWKMGLDSNKDLFKKLDEKTKKKLADLKAKIKD